MTQNYIYIDIYTQILTFKYTKPSRGSKIIFREENQNNIYIYIYIDVSEKRKKCIFADFGTMNNEQSLEKVAQG